ncbi:MAG TPA: DUF5825 family protein [Streptosporangiaceae bacterium]|nr:DUF5825 family protein [Streptosporangiaceae bacterium]
MTAVAGQERERFVLGADPVATARAVQALREAYASKLRCRWTGEVAGEFDLGQVVHLPPPDELAGRDGALDLWRARHRYGMFHFRIGPGFVIVIDKRLDQSASRYVIDDPAMLAVFLDCSHAIDRLDRMDAGRREAAEILCAEGLLLRLGEVVVTLPIRLRKWPVPYRSV